MHMSDGPRAESIFVTQSGAVGVMAALSSTQYNFLLKLQENLSQVGALK